MLCPVYHQLSTSIISLLPSYSSTAHVALIMVQSLRMGSIMAAIFVVGSIGQCSPAEQGSWYNQPWFTYVYTDCSRRAMADPKRTAVCLEEEARLSPSCGGCFGIASKCVASSCMLHCLKPESPRCWACMDRTDCQQSLMTCVGAATIEQLPLRPGQMPM